MSLSITAVPIPTPAAARWLPWFAGSLLLAAICWSFYGTIGKPDCMDLDFGAYYRAVQAVAQGQSPYFVDDHGPLGTYPYAPAFPFLLIPLSHLPYLWACRLWLTVNWLALGACCNLALRLVSPSARFRTPVLADAASREWMLALALLPIAAYAWATLRVGQVSLLMLLGCLAWADCRRSGRRFTGGLALAAACALKLAPGVFVLYLMLRRDYRGLVGVAAGTALLFLAPTLWVGIPGTLQLHRDWIHHTTATQVPVQTYRPGNQALLGQLARLPAISNGHELYSETNLERLCALYPAIVLTAVILGFGVLRLRKRAETLELALLFALLTLAQPRGWRCNFVAMLLPALLLAREICRRGHHWRMAAAALLCMTLACAWPTNGLSAEGWSLPLWLLQGKHFWGAVAVGVAVWRVEDGP